MRWLVTRYDVDEPEEVEAEAFNLVDGMLIFFNWRRDGLVGRPPSDWGGAYNDRIIVMAFASGVWLTFTELVPEEDVPDPTLDLSELHR